MDVKSRGGRSYTDILIRRERGGAGSEGSGEIRGGRVDRRLMDDFTVYSSDFISMKGSLRKKLGSEVMAAKFSTDDRFVCVGLADGTVAALSTTNNKSAAIEVSRLPITCLAWLDRNRLLAADAEGRVFHLEVGEGPTLAISGSYELKTETLSMDVDTGAELAALGTKSGAIIFLDPKRLREVGRLEPGDAFIPGHSSRVFSVRFGQHGTLASGGWDASVLLWDSRTRRSSGRILGPVLSGDSLDLKGDFLLAGSYREKDNLDLYDLRNRQKIVGLDFAGPRGGATNHTSACRFGTDPKGNELIIAGSCVGNQLAIFRKDILYKPELYLLGVNKGVFATGFSNAGGSALFGSGDGDLNISSLAFD